MSTQSATVSELFAALSSAQGEIEGASKDSINPHFKNKYADLASCWSACRAPLSKHGLAVLQPSRTDGPVVTVNTIVAHKSGEWIAEEISMTATVNTPQGIGSAITYARRYQLCAMVGIAPEDDDGNDASQRNGGYSVEPPARTTVGNSADRREREKPSEPNGGASAIFDTSILPHGAVYITKVEAGFGGKAKGFIHTSDQLPGSDGFAVFDDRMLGLASELCQNRTPALVSFKTSANGKDYVKAIAKANGKLALPSIDINADLHTKPITVDDIPFSVLLPLLASVAMLF